jgi:hypothetical protein
MNFPPDIVAFLRKPNFMILSEHNTDGTIHSTIVWYEFDENNNTFRVSITSARKKYTNINKDPQVTFAIPNTENMYQYVAVSGKVTGQTREGGHDFIDSEAKRYMNKDKYPYDLKRKDDRVTITITPEKFFSVGFESSRN